MGTTITDDIRKVWLDQCALQRLATVDDVAQACVLLSDCSYLNGQAIELDGGKL
jgi:NAD(P)-dependent dehydrogenase (short-subunit alcohol dehydrogenase family)